ncbi:BirA, biotin-(Acetyl-CoA-carboxylase) ligase [metagenome]|uniref:BirA, biotin-(Acetyl-CoA-carboxylase) ligase n=1 Tax=metagenome TaxID=256318 RepID=A0A2P2C4X2_9ZZZZ
MADNGVWRRSLDEVALSAAPWPVEVLEETGSTNAVLAERARQGGAQQVLVTEHQTAGRGRLDRTWVTPDRAALTFSVLLRPEVDASRWPWLPLLVGEAVRAALAVHEVELSVKWPNDVLIGELKVAGILLERVDGSSGPAAVVGVGINVSTAREELPVDTATSLGIELSSAPDRTGVLLAVLAELHRSYAEWSADGSDEFLRAAYVRHCSTIGRQVRVDLPGGSAVHGTARDVDARGRLVVESPAGTTVVGAGDVVHVRSSDQ